MIKDIIKIFGANIVKTLVALIVTFIIPKLLTIEGFGHYKLFAFYCSYLGLIQFGFCDGIYLKYGGMNEEEINKNDLEIEQGTFFLYELILSVTIFIVGVFFKCFEVSMLGIIVFPLHMYSFYSFYYQATGQLSEYSKRLTISNIFNVFIYGVLIFINTNDYHLYIIAMVISNIFLFFLFFIPFQKKDINLVNCFNTTIFFQTCKFGLLLMLGNIMGELFLGLDKWFIRFTLPLTDFSYYSFAGQIIRTVNMIITPISMTLYSYISKERNIQFERDLLEKLLLLVALIPLGSYISEIIIHIFLPKYIPSITVIEILMFSQIFWAINVAIFVNLFKAYKLQRIYFIKIIVSLVIALILHLFIALYKPDICLYSLMTLVTAIVWLIINSKSFKHMQFSFNNIGYICSLLLISCVIFDSTSTVKIAVYLFSYLIFSYVFKKSDLCYCLNKIYVLLKHITVKVKL